MAESTDQIGIAYANATNPEAPEYGKGFKRQHNSGCCGSCGETNCGNGTSPPATQEVIRQRKTREDF